jgi:hypothetical protein
MAFKILTNRLPVKWQKDLRETLGDLATSTAAEAVPGDAKEIVIGAANSQIVDDLVKWIQRMNRLQKPAKSNAKEFPNQGISLALERADGAKITLTERNAGVVKQFLSSGE